jgi:hypothetical protein
MRGIALKPNKSAMPLRAGTDSNLIERPKFRGFQTFDLREEAQSSHLQSLRSPAFRSCYELAELGWLSRRIRDRLSTRLLLPASHRRAVGFLYLIFAFLRANAQCGPIANRRQRVDTPGAANHWDARGFDFVMLFVMVLRPDAPIVHEVV